MKANIKYSPKKMWYISCFVRGMTVDEAVKQLSFMYNKGAEIAKEVILEAQRLAVEEHNVEFKSNLWVGEYMNQSIFEISVFTYFYILNLLIIRLISRKQYYFMHLIISCTAESFSTKGIVIKGIRRHARARMGVVHYRYCHYFVRLEEGPPPKQYYLPHPKTGEELLNDWMKQLHMRKIPNSL